jgi:hypothetical protein
MSQKKRPAVVVCTYGPSGIGKTTDQGYSFPHAIFVAAPGALQSIESVCGYVPATATAKNINEATKLVEREKNNYSAIVIDDFSHLVERTFSQLEKKLTGYKLWGELRDQALEFRDAARYCGVDVILNCWEQSPKAATATSGEVRGGPQLSGKLPESIPAMCDVVLRASQDKQRVPWPGVYRCSSDSRYVMKDRFNIAPLIDPAPMNLAEILRAAGLNVERHPAIAQYEPVIEDFAIKLEQAIEPLAEVNDLFTVLVSEGVAEPAARWILRDALDRCTIRKALAARRSSFITITPGKL